MTTVEQARANRRRWLDRHPDYARSYYERNREQILARQKAHYKAGRKIRLTEFPELRARRVAAAKGRQEFSASKAVRTGLRWTPDETALLAELVSEGLPVFEIALILGRTQAATYERKRRI